MPDTLLEKFKEMPEIEYPAALHSRIMTAVVLFRFKRTFWPVFSMLVVNLIVVSSFFFLRLAKNDTSSFIGFMVREFEASRNYFLQFLSVLYNDAPLGLFLTLVVNLVLIIYAAKNYFLLRRNIGRVFLEQNV